MQVLLVGAHAADMEFSAGHVACLYATLGHAVTFVHLTAGEKGHPTLSAQDYRRQKVEEAHEAARRMGAQVRILDHPDGELAATDEVAWEVADTFRELRPQVVITHWEGSFHSDHANTHRIVRRALFLAGLAAFVRPHPPWRVPNVFYPENWEDLEGFAPDTYLDISSVYDRWMDGARAYQLFRGGVSAFRYQEYYASLASLRGCLGGFPKAAALMRPPSTRTAYGRELPLRD
jgi:LmbE family N-acetylglucosaminyl deacetylase